MAITKQEAKDTVEQEVEEIRLNEDGLVPNQLVSEEDFIRILNEQRARQTQG
jgi:hypothetical protein